MPRGRSPCTQAPSAPSISELDPRCCQGRIASVALSSSAVEGFQNHDSCTFTGSTRPRTDVARSMRPLSCRRTCSNQATNCSSWSTFRRSSACSASSMALSPAISSLVGAKTTASSCLPLPLRRTMGHNGSARADLHEALQVPMVGHARVQTPIRVWVQARCWLAQLHRRAR